MRKSNTKIEISAVGKLSEIKKTLKKYNLTGVVTKTEKGEVYDDHEMTISGEKENIKRYLTSKEYGMDKDDLQEFYPELFRTGGVAGSKHVDVTKGYRLQHGYKAVKGSDKNYNYSKGKKKVKVDAGWRLPHGYEVVDGAYNKKYEDGGMMAKGGGVSSKEAKAMKQLEKHIKYNFVNTDMGSGWKFYLDGFDLEMRYLDIFDAEGIDDWEELSKEDKKYYYDEWKESLWQSSYEQFKELAFKKYGYYYMEQGGNMSSCWFYEIGGL